MADRDSALDPAQIAKARALLAKTQPGAEPVWPALAAAAFAAFCALALAAAVITAPPPAGEKIVLKDQGAP